MKTETETKKVRIGLLLKISGIFSILLLVAIIVQAIMNVMSIQTSSMEAAKLVGQEKLKGDIATFQKKLDDQYGQLSLKNGDLVDQNGVSLRNDFRIVDYVADTLNVRATIFVKENQDYRRITTSITDDNGKRAVDSFLGTTNSAYKSIQSGEKYIGDSVILGHDYQSAYQPVFAPNSKDVIGILFVGVEMSSVQSLIVENRNEAIVMVIIQALIILVIAIVIIFLFARSIVKPIISIANMLKGISEDKGDLTTRIYANSNDEVGDLAHFFNLTLSKIKDLVMSIKKEIVLLSGIGDRLSADMNETAASINEITSSIQNMKERVQKQSGIASETHSTMEALVDNIHKLDNHVENLSNHIAQSSAAIEEMVANIQSVTNTLVKNTANVKNLRDASEVGRGGLSEVVADIQEIARESEGLLEINSVMENIASQTNLLSMNAAIEAAHAGEAGKGFAVVADEIRKLAENSSVQSKTISTVLKKIKSSIDNITHSTDNVLSKFEAIDSSVKTVAEQEETIRGAMEEQGIGSKQILDGIEELNTISREVKNNSREMLEDAKVVIGESESLDQSTQEITTGMTEMTEGLEHINIAVNDINDISIKNREGIDLLKTEASHFKVE
ncbi:MAG: methyl-accepting chemotaxis protein [Treponema sp.]|nr:methyl-accepting chemotaxis protein [Treponema sp.]